MRVIMAAVAVPRVRAGRAMMARFADGLRVKGTHVSAGIQPR